VSQYPYVETAQRFARETATHRMTVLHDDGLYRHLAFRSTEHGWNLWFDLITVPGALIFQGDGDAYTFRRLEDMFEFFRQPGGAAINPGYWGEKLTGRGGRDGVMHYDQDLMAECVNESVADAVEYDPEVLVGLAAAVREQVLEELMGDESIDRQTVEQFRYWANPDDEHAWPSKQPDFEFTHVWEWDTRDFDWWFLWACQAIVWGIAQYDAHAVPRPITGATPRRLREAAGLKCTPLVAPEPTPPVVRPETAQDRAGVRRPVLDIQLAESTKELV
jgi:hypothetical protein